VVLKRPEVIAAVDRQAFVLNPSTPAEFREFIKDQIEITGACCAPPVCRSSRSKPGRVLVSRAFSLPMLHRPSMSAARQSSLAPDAFTASPTSWTRRQRTPDTAADRYSRVEFLLLQTQLYLGAFERLRKCRSEGLGDFSRMPAGRMRQPQASAMST